MIHINSSKGFTSLYKSEFPCEEPKIRSKQSLKKPYIPTGKKLISFKLILSLLICLHISEAYKNDPSDFDNKRETVSSFISGNCLW